MMGSQHNLFIIFLLFIFFIMWEVWELSKAPNSQQNMPTNVTLENTSNEDNVFTHNQKEKITVKTDVLECTINVYGGDVEQALLLAYLKKLNSCEPFQLLETTSDFVYQAQSGLIGRDGPDNSDHGIRPLYNVHNNTFILDKNKNELVIPMNYKDSKGNLFIKIFTFKRGEYAIKVDHIIQNNSLKTIELSSFGQIKQSINLPSYRNDTKNNNFALHAFRGAAYSTSNKKYKKYKFDTISDNENLNTLSFKGGWVAMLQQYFVTAWIPDNNGTNNFYTANLGKGVVSIGYKTQPIFVQPNQVKKIKSILWIGPEIQDKMATIAPYLDLTVDYGWLWFIAQPLFNLLKFIHGFLGNWGFSIIMITFIVRGIMYPLTKAQYLSIAKMRMIQPKIREIQNRLGNDKQRLGQEMMLLYKAEKVNPFGGCFPILIQMPIFLALYYMLIGSVELRHAPFVLWIHDLSSQDPYYILPILMGVTMYFIQKISPTSMTDPIQQKVVTFMPFIFMIFFLWFPSGLVLYYIVSNLVTIIQQQLIYRGLENCGLHDFKK